MKKESDPPGQTSIEVAPPTSVASLVSYSATLANIVDTFPIMLASFTSNGRCLFVNKGARPLFNKRRTHEKPYAVLSVSRAHRG
jgi:hypothetical protein